MLLMKISKYRLLLAPPINKISDISINYLAVIRRDFTLLIYIYLYRLIYYI